MNQTTIRGQSLISIARRHLQAEHRRDRCRSLRTRLPPFGRATLHRIRTGQVESATTTVLDPIIQDYLRTQVVDAAREVIQQHPELALRLFHAGHMEPGATVDPSVQEFLRTQTLEEARQVLAQHPELADRLAVPQQEEA